MPALVENMFSVREVPWHGQGIILDNPPTAEEAIVAAGLDWELESLPIYTKTRKKIPGYFANTRTSDGAVLGVVSQRYTIVQNKEAFAFVDSLVDEGLTYETAGSLRDGKCIWLLAKMPQTKILDDALEPYICFTNTHDGTGSIRVCCTPVRVVCWNTLNLALNTAKRSWSTRHIGNMEGKLAEARETLGLVSHYISELQDEAELLAETKLSDASLEGMLDLIYPVKDTDSDIRKRRIEDLKQSVFTCLAAPDVTPYKGSAYAAIMAVTDYADHARPMRNTSNFEENRWGQIIVGHPFVDAVYKQIKTIA